MGALDTPVKGDADEKSDELKPNICRDEQLRNTDRVAQR